MKTAGSSEMLIPICQITRIQIPEIHNPAHYIMPQLLDFLKVTANNDTRYYAASPRSYTYNSAAISRQAASWETQPVNVIGQISG
jgi:hypothetical protein